MDNELWVILLPIVLLPVFFAMGWFVRARRYEDRPETGQKHTGRLLQKP